MFASEKCLVDAFEQRAGAFLKAVYGGPVSRIFSIREFDSQHGVADIVLGTFKEDFSARWARRPVNENWIAPLLRLRSGGVIRLDSFAEQFGVSRRTARQQIGEYVAANFLVPVGENDFKMMRKYEPVVSGVVAIEAKLRDWKRALFQAMRYRRFSDFVFVLLDDDCVDTAEDNLEHFRSANIGLASMDDMSEQIHLHFVPHRTANKQGYYYSRLNEMAYASFVRPRAACY